MRLIDADALDRAFTDLRWNKDGTLAHVGDRPDWCLHGHEVDKLIRDAPTVGEWVSVKDRLPGSSGIKVIVSTKTVPESVLKTKAVFVAFLGYGDGKWYTPDVDFMVKAKTGNDNVHPVWEITHWMFLPEPPKEENENAID